MRITNSRLRRIIKEEAIKTLSGSDDDLSNYSYEELKRILSDITMRMSRMEKDMTDIDDRMISVLTRGDEIIGTQRQARM
jgi:hypothetical protein|tara:strand:+ start:243 stop:482 length:240 start_codon:yes stop_codon:yes gene_type:complete